MPVKKVCILGLSNTGVPLSIVIALKCPEIRVFVLHKSSELVFSMNTGRIPPEIYIPGMEDVVRFVLNKNLIFTTNEKQAIKDAEMILILSNSTLKTFGEGEFRTVDLTTVKDAALLIADCAESEKIILESSSIPLKSVECMRNIFNRYGKPSIKYHIISQPEFYDPGTSLQNFMNPGLVLIGRETSPESLSVAKDIANIYYRWIPHDGLALRGTWSIELSNICIFAILALTYSAIQSVAPIFEELGGDIADYRSVLGSIKEIGTGIFDDCFNFGKLPMAVRNIVYLFEHYNILAEAHYWQAVLDMFNYRKTIFKKNFVMHLNGNISNKIISVLGFANFKDLTLSEGSSAADLCNWLLEENASVNVYQSEISKMKVIDALTFLGSRKSVEDMNKLVKVYDDPYKAIEGSRAIIFSCPSPEFMELNFNKIFKSMLKPAHVFDIAEILPYPELSQIGFIVCADGKYI